MVRSSTGVPCAVEERATGKITTWLKPSPELIPHYGEQSVKQKQQKAREGLARCLLFLFQYAHEDVDGQQRVVSAGLVQQTSWQNGADFLLYNEVMPAPQIVL